MMGEAVFAWWLTLLTPLLFLDKLHPLSPGHPLNPFPVL
jgi:hypothetical protein